MSLLNVWIKPREALVAVDTEGVGGDGSRKPMSKVMTLPHLNAVIALRGNAHFLGALLHVCLSRTIASFDELLAEMPGNLALADALVPAALRHPEFPDTELIVVGWSLERSRMLGRLFAKRGEEQEFSGHDTEGCIAPYDAATMAHLPRTEHAVQKIARAQVRYMRSERNIGGGVLILCRVDRQAVTMRHAMVFETEEEAVCQP